MGRFLAAGFIMLLSFGVALSGEENPPTESSNLYDRMGVITERGLHGAVPEENVDLFSGNLVLKNLDITLPGPNGFDLNIWRVYNSKVNTESTNFTRSDPQQESSSWVGYGWSMHMGRILNPDSTNPTIEFPDGRQEGTYPWIHDPTILITRNFLQLKKAERTVHFQDGTVWTCGASAILWLKGTPVQAALVTKITNSYGHEINITYVSGGSSKISQITDALGRVVTFNLDGNGNLDSIIVPHEDGTVTYDYTVTATAWGDSAYTRLELMQPPVLNPVSYVYSDASTKELNQVTTSYGGTITYTFSDQDFAYFADTLHTRALTSKSLQFSTGNTATWTYEYGDYSGVHTITVINLETGLLDKQVNGGYTIVHGPEFDEVVWFCGPQPESAYGWLAGLMSFKDIYKKGDHVTSLANTQCMKAPEQISTDFIWVRGQNWGPATAALEIGGFQTKVGTTKYYNQILYNDPVLRKYGLPSGVDVAVPNDPAIPTGIQKTSVAKAGSLNRVFAMNGGALSGKSQTKDDPMVFYTRYKKALNYTFTGNADFLARSMLSLLSKETYYDQENAVYKETSWEYFSNGAIQKVHRWKTGGTTLDWDYTYAETSGPSEITITIDPPGNNSGIETNVYKNGTLARVAKPEFVEYDRDIYADGLIHTETNQHGGTMTFTYDDIGRITQIAMPSGFNPISANWSQNSVAITRGGNTLTKYWDGMGRNLGFEENGAGVSLHSRRDLDGEGRVKAESKGAVDSSHKTIFDLNENGQPKQVTDPTGKWTKFAYADNTCTITDMKGNQKVLTYAHLPGLVTKVVQENTQTDSYYKGENRLYLVKSSSSGESTRSQEYSQNGMDQLISEYHPETGTINYQYNDEGNLANKTWGDATFSYTYNASNQLKTENDGGETITFNYDSSGRVEEIESSASQWRRYDITYNQLGAVTSEKQAIIGIGTDKTMGYHYDGNGLLDEITYPDGRKAAYGNNALLLPTSLSFNSETNRVSAVTYGVNKQPLGYTLGNGTTFAATYDHAGRIVTSGLQKSGETLLAATYGYDEVGNIDSLTSTTPAGDASFHYDAFNRLTNATYPEKIYDYTYDPFGNMLTAKENSLNVFNKTYTAQNRVSGLTYDSRGNLTQGEGFTQVWDKRNRLSESRITATNGLLGTYSYNERGLRVKTERYALSTVQVVVPNGGESLYLGAMNTISWSGIELAGAVIKLELLVNNVVTGTIAEGLPGTQTGYQWQAGKILGGAVPPGSDYKVRVTAVVPAATTGATYYFYDSGGRLLSEYDGTGTCVKDYLYLGGKMIGEFLPATSTYYYYASDQINSTRLVTDASGAVVHSAQYDPYGGLYKTWVDTYHPKPGFSGKERESSSELDCFGARYYGHKQYRFLSVDQGINNDEALANPQLWNLYTYCRNNPITYLDPDGRDEILVWQLTVSCFAKVLPYILAACDVYNSAGGLMTQKTRAERGAWIFEDGSHELWPPTPDKKDSTDIAPPSKENQIASVHNHPNYVTEPQPNTNDMTKANVNKFHRGKPMMTVSNKGIWVYDSSRTPEEGRIFQAVSEESFKQINKVYEENK